MFYDTVNELCKQRNTSITRMTKEIGLSNAAASSWRNGSIPKLDTVRKVAEYFGVSMEDLLSNGPAPAIRASDRSTVAYGNSGPVATNGASITQAAASELSDMELELLKVFRALDMRKKNALMSAAYDMEDAMRKEG